MATWKEIRRRWKEGTLGFRIDETMSGEHWFEPGCGPKGRHAFEFKVTWGSENLAAWMKCIAGGVVSQLSGTVTVGGMCEAVPCAGVLEIRYFDEHKIRYQFEFRTGGSRYRFVGEKLNIRPWNLLTSHTTCFGTLTDVETGRLVSRSLTHFRLLSTPGFLRSARFA